MSKNQINVPLALVASAVAATLTTPAFSQGRATTLEETIVTAQKRVESLQEAPIAITAMGTDQLAVQNLASMTDFQAGAIPTLRISPFPSNPATQVVFIRGVGNADAEQATKEMGVGVYLDSVYLGRATGMAMELADLERVEVLRGPQGTLYGRNALGGAVNMVTQKPTGEFGFDQTFSIGNYDYFRSVTKVDLPQTGAFSAKLAYLTSEKEGWVENLDRSQADYAESDSEGFRVAVSWDASDNLTVDYSYDQSEIEPAQLYYQVDESTIPPEAGGLPPEPGRDEETRFPVNPFEPNVSEAEGHTLNIGWEVNDLLELRSITGQREIDNEVFANFAGALAFGGLVTQAANDQDQFSQELQLVGGTSDGRLEYVAGLYYFEEEVNDSVVNAGSLIIPGMLIPYGPPQIVNAEVESWAAFGQLTWTPNILEERLHMTFGLRYTEDEKEGVRDIGGNIDTFDIESDNTDPTLTVDYEWSDSVSTYLRWANGYRAGGANLRSATFRSYEEETLENWELGLKSELFDRRVRFNAALFKSYYDDKQIDFSDPFDITVSETINASEQIEIEGLELDLTAILTEGLLLGVQWVYMDYDVPLIFNPLTGVEERFELPQTPEYSGSVSLDYTFDPFSFGTLSANLTWNYSDDYWFSAQNFKRDSDGYELLNARISLDEIPLGGGDYGKLRVSIWGKNLTDDEWYIHGIVSNLAPGLYQSARAYGEPRTYGLDIQYVF